MRYHYAYGGSTVPIGYIFLIYQDTDECFHVVMYMSKCWNKDKKKIGTKSIK